jgi:hypothetical protein
VQICGNRPHEAAQNKQENDELGCHVRVRYVVINRRCLKAQRTNQTRNPTFYHHDYFFLSASLFSEQSSSVAFHMCCLCGADDDLAAFFICSIHALRIWAIFELVAVKKQTNAHKSFLLSIQFDSKNCEKNKS